MKRALLPALVLFSSVPLLAADLLPPGEVLSSLDKSNKKPGEGSANAADALAAKLEAFTATAPSLTPQEAAKTWLELFEAWRELSPSERNKIRNPATSGFSSLVRSLPPPAAWEALQSEIAAGPTKDILIDQLLALFSATLNNDDAGQLKAFNAIATLKESDYSKSPSLGAVKKVMGEYVGKYLNSLVQDLAPPLAQLSDDPAEVRQILEAQLKAILDLQEGYLPTLVLPSIAALGGEKPATEFIKKVLSSGAELESSDPKIRAIARTLILEDPARLKAPHWNLVDDFGEQNIRLYQLLEKKFANDENGEYDRKEAGKFYLMSLIVADKFDAAYKWLTSIKDLNDRSLGYDAQQLAISQGKGENVLNFLFMALAKDPSLPLWSELIGLAAREDRSGEALELTRTAAKSKKLEASDRENLLSLLTAAALADGKVDEAAGFMRERMAILKEEGPESHANAFDIAERLAVLGQLLKRDDLRDEGIREALAIASAPSEHRRLSSDFIDLLVKSGRATDAQNLIIAGMKPALNRGTDYAPMIDLTDNLSDLAGLYDQAGRPNDVLKLLAEAPWWKTPDLAGVVTEKDFRGVSMGEMAARAFAANDDKPKAIETLKETLKSIADDDSAYQMLIELDGQNAIPFLDAQFADNQFQERPLIWKAVLQFQAGQTAEAETTIRQAIAIDPSDGEMGRDDRMRAYAVLADILEKTGKEADAKIYRGAVQAVRLSEEADKYVSAGLLSQAITMYKEALGYFADAYCIQSRLAVHLATQGQTKEAEEHYRRAYELMPDSFGRMESHCFGCERAFDGLMAETLAEKTFRRLIAENPTKPQLHYLMGYLRMEQEKPEDALAYFQKAVELDPDYINAWKKILSLDGSILLPNAVRNDAALAIIWLQQNPSSGELRKVTDLKKVWTLTEEIRRSHPNKKPQDLLRLDATAQYREETRNRSQYNPYPHPQFLSQELLESPGSALIQQEFMQQLSRAFDQVSQLRR
jgi:tetratricopeptide (TPR) repeat protein